MLADELLQLLRALCNFDVEDSGHGDGHLSARHPYFSAALVVIGITSSDKKCTYISKLAKAFIEKEYKDDFEAYKKKLKSVTKIF